MLLHSCGEINMNLDVACHAVHYALHTTQAWAIAI